MAERVAERVTERVAKRVTERVAESGRVASTRLEVVIYFENIRNEVKLEEFEEGKRNDSHIAHITDKS